MDLDSDRVADTWLARERLREKLAGSDDLRVDASHRYLRIVRDQNQPAMVRIKAQERIDKLLGLEGPIKFAASNKTGDGLTDEQRRARLLGILGALQQAAKLDAEAESGTGGHAGNGAASHP